MSTIRKYAESIRDGRRVIVPSKKRDKRDRSGNPFIAAIAGGMIARAVKDVEDPIRPVEVYRSTEYKRD